MRQGTILDVREHVIDSLTKLKKKNTSSNRTSEKLFLMVERKQTFNCFRPMVNLYITSKHMVRDNVRFFFFPNCKFYVSFCF